MSFLDSIRREWQMAADAVVVDGSDLAEEMHLDFAGHEREAGAKYQSQQELSKCHPEQRKLSSAFVHGWYSARNSCAAQGGHAGGRGHNLGPGFGVFENIGPNGPEMGA